MNTIKQGICTLNRHNFGSPVSYFDASLSWKCVCVDWSQRHVAKHTHTHIQYKCARRENTANGNRAFQLSHRAETIAALLLLYSHRFWHLTFVGSALKCALHTSVFPFSLIKYYAKWLLMQQQYAVWVLFGFWFNMKIARKRSYRMTLSSHSYFTYFNIFHSSNISQLLNLSKFTLAPFQTVFYSPELCCNLSISLINQLLTIIQSDHYDENLNFKLKDQIKQSGLLTASIIFSP